MVGSKIMSRTFRERLREGPPLLATFLKTPHPIVMEVMALCGFDSLVLDAEHSPFGRAEIDSMLLAGRALDIPVVVRVPNQRPDTILSVLDGGAAGVMVPHVNTPEQAHALARAMDYGEGGRGFAGTTRAGGYGTRPAKEHRDRAREEVALICQIEDPEGARNVEAIAEVEGVDALFVGRADLAVGLGKEDFFDEEIGRLTARILANPDAATGLYCPPQEELSGHRAGGARFFVVGSDHTAMQGGAKVGSWRAQLNATDSEDR